MRKKEAHTNAADITLPVTPRMQKRDAETLAPSLAGHLGTHFDVMNKEFPLAYTRRKGILFDVRNIRNRDIDLSDISLEPVEQDFFVIFRTGFIEEIPYGEPGYFSTHPQLSEALVDALLQKGVSIIGIDCGGIRRGREHVPIDQHCADRGTFVIENLWDLGQLPTDVPFTVHTYPMRFEGITGLPCRVIAETL